MNVLVSGGQGGIGAAVTRALSKNKANRVFSFDVAPAIGTQSNGHVTVDLTDFDVMRVAVKKLVEAHGPVDVLVNAIGYYGVKNTSTFDWNDWRKTLKVNLEAPVFLALECAKHMRTGGKIINITSAAAYLGSADVGYGASKAGLAGATKSLAKGLAKRGIDVINLAPGLVQTSMSARMPPGRKAKHVRRMLSQRMGSAEEIARFVRFLAETETTYWRGSVIHVNGGEFLA